MKYICTLLICFSFLNITSAQNEISWLSDYKGEVVAGSYTYQYIYQSFEDNACKLKIEATKTNKKGSSEIYAYEFYLSDLDENQLSFKPTGKYINVSLKTLQDQKFIQYYENGSFKSYTNEVVLVTDAVDKARGIIDAFKENKSACVQEDISWENIEEAGAWLSANIGEYTDGEKKIKQTYSKGNKEYLASIKVEGEDAREYIFNLSDLNPSGIQLVVTGTNLWIQVPVKENKYFIQVIDADGAVSYDKDFSVIAQNVELARNQVAALKYIAANITVERKPPASYASALSFVKENLAEVQVGSNTFSPSLEYADSPSGLSALSIKKMDAKGMETVTDYSWYMDDMQSVVNLKASSKAVEVQLYTKDKLKTLQVRKDGELQSYAYSLEIYCRDIESARELINALEYAQLNSQSGMLNHNSISAAAKWIRENVGKVDLGSTVYSQQIKIDEPNQNKLSLSVLKTSSNTSTNNVYHIYPEDIDRDAIELNIVSKELSVPLSTGKSKFIQNIEEDDLGNYLTKVKVVFDDVQKARNFIGALKYIAEHSVLGRLTWQNEDDVIDYFQDNLQTINISGNEIKQAFEKEEGSCKSFYTQTTTDSKGVSTAYKYEFLPSDIDPETSKIVVSGNKLSIELVTNGQEKLIKPLKNGEPQNFDYNFEVYVQDVLVAKKLLDAFQTYAKGCK